MCVGFTRAKVQTKNGPNSKVYATYSVVSGSSRYKIQATTDQSLVIKYPTKIKFPQKKSKMI